MVYWGMKTYRPWNPRTRYLLPQSMSDWLPDDHLVYFIIDIVADLDLAPIEGVLQEKDGRGTRPSSTTRTRSWWLRMSRISHPTTATSSRC